MRLTDEVAAEVLPRARPDLELLTWPGRDKSPPACFARDPKSGGLFELGPEGFFLVQQLDGATTVGQALQLYREKFGAPLPREELDVFLQQLEQGGLLAGTEAAPRALTFPETFDPEIFLPVGRIPLLRGDAVLGRLATALRWIFSRPIHLMTGSLVLWAIQITYTSWSRLMETLAANWTLEFALYLFAAACLGVQSPRALVHGLVCKRYGGQVAQIGLGLLYYVLPSVYVDWSGVIWVRGKNRRLWVVASGIYFQIALWAAATIGWSLTHPGGFASTVLFALLTASGLGLFLYNGNPLIKMDAYLLVVNWIEIPRLRERALAAFGTWVTLREPAEPLTRRQARWFQAYGGACFLYGMFLIGLHLWWAWSVLTPSYEGAGAIATLLLAVYLFQKPLAARIRRLAVVRWLFAGRAPVRRGLVVATLLASLLIVAFLPYRTETGGPVQLLPARRLAVRAEIEGKVEVVLVREGASVEAGDAIARIDARSIESKLKSAEAQLASALADLALLQAGAKIELIRRAESEVGTARATADWSHPRSDRFAEMYRDRLVSQQDYENALRRRDLDRARLDEAEADLRLVRSDARPEAVESLRARTRRLEVRVEGYRADLERATIRSPIAGRVVTPRPESLIGAYLKPGLRDLVMEIEDPRTLRGEIRVPEEDAAGIQPGSPVSIVIWSRHRETIEGEVVEVAPAAAPAAPAPDVASSGAGPARLVPSGDDRRVVRVLTEIPNPGGTLRSDMTGFAKIPIGTRPLWDAYLRPVVRWVRVEVWSWIP